MPDINIQQIPDAPSGYDLVGKKIMIHDQAAPLIASTVMIPALSFGAASGAGGGYFAPIFLESLAEITAGIFTFQYNGLIGATEMNYIIVNKTIEFIDEDYTFDNITGTITRVNIWQVGDKLITPYKAAIT